METPNTPEPAPKLSKSHHWGGPLKTPEEWVALLKEANADTHLAAWAASVILWDYDGTVDLAPLEALMDGYDREQAHRPTSDLVELLTKLGYPNPDGRCRLAEDKDADRTKRRVSQWDRIQPRREKRPYSPVVHGLPHFAFGMRNGH